MVGGRAPLLQRQTRLCAIKCLHLTLLVAAQHQCMLCRGHVQPHDVFELVGQQRIARDIEAMNKMRLDTVCSPMEPDAGCAAPVCGRRRRCLCGQLDQASNVNASMPARCSRRTLVRLDRTSRVNSPLYTPMSSLIRDWICVQAISSIKNATLH
jgi:hypothetical protein